MSTELIEEMGRWLRTSEVARLLGVSGQTVRRLGVKKFNIRTRQLPGMSTRYYFRDDVLELMEKNKVQERTATTDGPVRPSRGRPGRGHSGIALAGPSRLLASPAHEGKAIPMSTRLRTTGRPDRFANAPPTCRKPIHLDLQKPTPRGALLLTGRPLAGC